MEQLAGLFGENGYEVGSGEKNKCVCFYVGGLEYFQKGD